MKQPEWVPEKWGIAYNEPVAYAEMKLPSSGRSLPQAKIDGLREGAFYWVRLRGMRSEWEVAHYLFGGLWRCGSDCDLGGEAFKIGPEAVMP